MLQCVERFAKRQLYILTRMASSTATGVTTDRPASCFKGKVELHVHLDGAIRAETLFDVATQRGLKLPAKDAKDLRKFCCYAEEGEHSLQRFLDTFNFFLPIIQGDVAAIERIAYEFCQDQAKMGVVYTEARYAPHLVASTVTWDHYTRLEYHSEERRAADAGRSAVTPGDVVAAVSRGFKRGCAETGVMVKALLCCMTHRPELSLEVAELAHKYRDDGVVGIDLAGFEGAVPMKEHQPAFERAKELGIHRTVHAGEVGVARNVQTAIETLHAERIGHGYAVLDDSNVYDIVKQHGTHLEACIYSSYLTGALRNLKLDLHPVQRWCADRVNCSLSTDDPGVMQCTIEEEYARARNLEGLTDADLVRMCFNAAHSCFLPEAEKKDLVAKLKSMHDEEVE